MIKNNILGQIYSALSLSLVAFYEQNLGQEEDKKSSQHQNKHGNGNNDKASVLTVGRQALNIVKWNEDDGYA